VDLLVIDEVSMLRADILDAIDFNRMRSAKGNYRDPFGGVQVLMIGDLYQFPYCPRYEWEILRQFYPSMHFFEAHAPAKSGMVYLEFGQDFRQQDENLLPNLNHLRDKKVLRMMSGYFNSQL